MPGGNHRVNCCGISRHLWLHSFIHSLVLSLRVSMWVARDITQKMPLLSSESTLVGGWARCTKPFNSERHYDGVLQWVNCSQPVKGMLKESIRQENSLRQSMAYWEVDIVDNRAHSPSVDSFTLSVQGIQPQHFCLDFAFRRTALHGETVTYTCSYVESLPGGLTHPGTFSKNLGYVGSFRVCQESWPFCMLG